MSEPQDPGPQSLAPADGARPVLSRRCNVCGIEQELNHRTYTKFRRGPGGYAETCRKCQGGFARAKQTAVQHGEEPPTAAAYFLAINPQWRPPADIIREAELAEDASDEVSEDIRLRFPALNRTMCPPYVDTPDKGQRKFWAFVHDATDALYDDHVSDRGRKRIVGALDRLIRDEGNPERGLRVLLETLRPMILDYVPLGVIHDDILGALLAPDTRRLILASRNSAKSTLVTAYLAWRLLLNPLLTITVVSKSGGHAGRLLRAVRAYIERNPVLQHLQPEEDAIDRADAFVVGPAHGKLGMGQSLLSIGATGQLTGTRAHLVVLDDVETAIAHGNVEAVDRLEDLFREATYLLQPGGELVTLGTPQTPFSIYGRLERSGLWSVSKARLFAFTAYGTLTSRWPDRWSPEELERKRREVGPIGWALHYDLSTDEDLSKAFPLKLKDLTVVEVDPLATKVPVDVETGPEGLRLEFGSAPAPAGDHWRGPVKVSGDSRPYIGTVCAIDPALGKAGRDAVGISIVSTSATGQAYIRAAEAIRAETPQGAMLRAAELIERFGVNTLIVETVGMQALWGQQLQTILSQRNYPLRVKDFSGGSQRKSARIIGILAPVFASGRVMVCRAVVESLSGGQLAKEITQVSAERTHTRNDDLVDALSMAIAEVSPAILTDRPVAITGIRSRIEAYQHLSLRRGGAAHPIYERMLVANDFEMELEARIQDAEAQLNENRRLGIPDPRLAATVNQWRSELDKLRG